MSWISSLDGPTKGYHEEVPANLLKDAENAAKRELEGEEEEDAPRGDANEAERMEE